MIFQNNDYTYNVGRTQGSKPGSVNLTGSGAKMMPLRNTILAETLPVNVLDQSGVMNQNNFYGSRANKRQAPSTVSAEAYLTSRISMRPVYTHNEMITRMQNVSDLLKSPPRFKDQVDLIA
tara:strand:+ start:487 stop:849 length:363 start_codon:yes stop_codon:yes gene_type:complete